MQYSNKWIVFILTAGICASCEDIIERDISEETITLQAPAEGVVLENEEVLFLWDPVEGLHTQYELQIVTPSFAAGQLLVDTLVSANKFSYSFDTGLYAWRVRALNGAYVTAYATAAFSVVLPQEPGPVEEEENSEQEEEENTNPDEG